MAKEKKPINFNVPTHIKTIYLILRITKKSKYV